MREGGFRSPRSQAPESGEWVGNVSGQGGAIHLHPLTVILPALLPQSGDNQGNQGQILVKCQSPGSFPAGEGTVTSKSFLIPFLLWAIMQVARCLGRLCCVPQSVISGEDEMTQISPNAAHTAADLLDAGVHLGLM